MITVYILAKNEDANIGKSLDALAKVDARVVLLDSGSTDQTLSIASHYSFVEIRHHDYTSHADAYNRITAICTANTDWAMVLDADMEVTEALWSEVIEKTSLPDTDALLAPILMYVEGRPLHFGSVCPPKAFVFRGGKEYFVPCGHGERLDPGVPVLTTSAKLIHNDTKDYSRFLLSQVQYSSNFLKRAGVNKLTWRDRLRQRLPVMPILVPTYSLLISGGIFSGKLGIIYALDRAIAELIAYRRILAARIEPKR